jgi:diguanylate cyclase (GGDEF)-like protein
MAFWKSKSIAGEKSNRRENLPGEAAADLILARVMDCAAEIIREYGRTAIDIENTTAETVRRWCENWAEHLLVGSSRPGDAVKRTSVEQRDWRGACKFFSERRQEETAFVSKTFIALQQAVWIFVQTIDGFVLKEDQSDTQLQGRLEHLKEVAQSGSALEMMRAEVLSSVKEIGRLAQERHQELRTQLKGLNSEVRELCNELEVARQEGAIDDLTRLFNRKAFDDRLGQAVSMSRLFGQTSSLLLVAIDGFAGVLRDYGREASEIVLKEMADCLARVFLVKTEFTARFGGEKFAVILWDVSLAKASTSAQKVLANLSNTRVIHNGAPIIFTVSIGVSQLLVGESSAAWLERTEQALETAKQQAGRRGSGFFVAQSC